MHAKTNTRCILKSSNAIIDLKKESKKLSTRFNAALIQTILAKISPCQKLFLLLEYGTVYVTSGKDENNKTEKNMTSANEECSYKSTQTSCTWNQDRSWF